MRRSVPRPTKHLPTLSDALLWLSLGYEPKECAQILNEMCREGHGGRSGDFCRPASDTGTSQGAS